MYGFTVFWTLFFTLGYVLPSSTVRLINSHQTCAFSDAIRVPAYANWPFGVNCKHLEEYWKNNISATGSDEFQCEITIGNETEKEGIFELTTVGDVVYTAKLIINNTYCVSSDVIIDLQPFPEENCSEIVNDAALRGEVISLEKTIGDTVVLQCIPPEGTPTLIPEGANRAEFETYWYTKCERKGYRNNKLWTNLPDGDGYPDKLRMPTVDFFDATNFTCTVTYKGRILYPVTYSLCIKQRTTATSPTVICTTVEREPNGGEAELNCTGQIVIGTTLSEDFMVEWGKKNEKGDFIPICKNSIFNETESGFGDSRRSCIASGNNDSLVCVVDGDAIPDDDIQRERKKIKIGLIINGLQRSDFGDYISRLTYKGKVAESESIKIEEDLEPFYEKLALGLGIALGVLLGATAVSLLLWRYWIYMLLLWKRWFGKRDQDNKRWVAYVSYYFNRDVQSEAERNTACKIVCCIQKVMENLELLPRYYDEQRQSDFAVAVESVTNVVEDCHRMILVLTPQYLDDQWGRFRVELGLNGFIKSRMGLMVILTPGTKKLLEKHAKGDEVWERLLIFLKTNRVINWKEKMSEDEVMAHIEYLLPKLGKPPEA